jgi:protein SCO1/2
MPPVSRGYNRSMNSPVRPPRQVPITFIVIAAFAAAIGLWLGQRFLAAPAQPKLQNAVLYPSPRAIPDFHLTQTNGAPLTLDAWRGRWDIVYFGYSSCPDVCPTTLATFKSVWRDLQARGLTDKVRFNFISVDPQRDTPELLGKYVSYFNPDFVAATGSDDELTRLTHSLGLIYSRTTDANGTIEVDHSGSAVIVDPDGKLIGLFRPPFDAPAVVSDMTMLMSSAK